MRLPGGGWLLRGMIFAQALCGWARAVEPCRVEVVERGSGWPVPLVELRTTHGVRFVSDNAGVIALDLPEGMGRELWYEVRGDGYEAAKDGFGNRGVRLTAVPGRTLRVEVSRTSVAKRLGRLTGGGIFAESQKTGRELEWRESGVFGCDSVQCAVHGGRMFWLWGDTTMPEYPLGIYDTTAATTAVVPAAVWEPPLRVRFDYFTDRKGRARAVAKMPGDGPTWLGALVELPDHDGVRHLAATYAKIHGHMDVYETGLCVWNEGSENFERLRAVWTKAEGAGRRAIPDGQPAFWKDGAGREWVYFGNPLPTLRCPATLEGWQDSAAWETLKPQESFVSADGKQVTPHTGQIAWNAWRKRWVAIFVEKFGKPSAFGEIWYAEAEAPAGPWGTAVKVLSHDNYTFYNPRMHPEFCAAGSPMLIFEGTYTAEFADHPAPTPRYNYNQVLYRIDLDDPALSAAQK